MKVSREFQLDGISTTLTVEDPNVSVYDDGGCRLLIERLEALELHEVDGDEEPIRLTPELVDTMDRQLAEAAQPPEGNDHVWVQYAGARWRAERVPETMHVEKAEGDAPQTELVISEQRLRYHYDDAPPEIVFDHGGQTVALMMTDHTAALLLGYLQEWLRNTTRAAAKGATSVTTK